MNPNKVPNRYLNGEEVKKIACKEFEAMLDRDCQFLKTIAYPRVAFTITATFHFGHPHETEHTVRSRVQKTDVIEGEAPLNPAPQEGEGLLLGLERDVVLENPNIDRVHHDLPIRVQRAAPPQPIVADNPLPGEPPEVILNPPQIDNIELKYDKADYPAPPPPIDRDVSKSEAERLGVRPRIGGLGLRKK